MNNIVVNVTYQGRSAEITFPHSGNPADHEIISITEEILRSDPPATFREVSIAPRALDGFTVDRQAGAVIFVRPSAAFG